MKNYNTLILLIAGQSKRFGGKVKKQFIKVDNKPIFIHTLINILKFKFDNIVLVSSKDEYLNENNIKTDYVFIHDGVRPLVTKKEILNLYNYVLKNDAAILASKVTDTIKKVDDNNNITETIDRTYLYRAATPQTFNFNKYLKAISKYMNADNKKLVTDDAEIYSKYSGKVGIIECSSNNIKITNREDLVIFKKLKDI